jgi:predicted dehydrogenase
MNAPLRFAMVGGGAGSQIGDGHRIAARMDGLFTLVAGAFDIDPERSRAFGCSLGLAPERAYGTWQEMLEGERDRDDRPDLVVVATPNASHFEIAHAFLDAGFDVLCEKPLATRLADAAELARTARRLGRELFVMYGYSGFPLVRQMRAMIRSGALGRIRVVQAEFAHGHHARAVERESPAAAWRYDPAVVGPSAVLADAGTHALHLARFATGLPVQAISAHFTSCVPGRVLEDNAQLALRFAAGAVGALWTSAVAVGQAHGLSIRIFGEDGGLAWAQERPNQLLWTPTGKPTCVLERGQPGLAPEALAACRISVGHSEGCLEAFANIWRDIATRLQARRTGTAVPEEPPVPDALDGVLGVAEVEAAVASAAAGGAWTEVRVPPLA